MKTSLIPLAAVILALVATSAGVLALTGGDTPIRSDEGIDPNECNLVHNIDACDQDDLDRLGGGGLLPVNPDAGNDGLCEPMPVRSDCGIDPSVSDVPAEVVNSWGVTTFRKAGEPYDLPDGAAGMTTIASRLILSLDRQLGRSHAIVIGSVIDISPTYFNSVDGGFWHEPSSYAMRSILQNVTIEVERVLGDTAGLTGVGGAPKESIVVTTFGGQIEVTFDESVDPASLPEGLEPGQTYSMSLVVSHVDLAEGDRVLVFLQMARSPWFGAPVDPESPWAKTPAAPCPGQAVGTKTVVYGTWHQLGAEDQQITVQERTFTFDALASEARHTGYAERAVTFDELEALAEAELGQSLEDPSAPIGPGNGRPSYDDHPPPPCYTPHPPPQEPSHTHPEYEN